MSHKIIITCVIIFFTISCKKKYTCTCADKSANITVKAKKSEIGAICNDQAKKYNTSCAVPI